MPKKDDFKSIGIGLLVIFCITAFVAVAILVPAVMATVLGLIISGGIGIAAWCIGTRIRYPDKFG